MFFPKSNVRPPFYLNGSLVSVNVNGLRDADKRLSFLQWLSHHSPLVVCLQETHALSADELSQWFSRFGFLCLRSFGSSHSCGVAILYRPVLSCSALCDFDGRFVLGEFTFRDSVFRVACCYAPNRNPDRDAFFQRCIDSIDPSVPTLLCGDFNTVPDRFIDRRGSCPFDTSRESSNLLSVLFRDCCVVDIWRLKHPGVSGFTWSKRDGSMASRIDLVGCPYPWISYVSSADILPCPYSDHSALHLSWSLSPVSPPGPGFWKLNTSILSEDSYFQLISDFWFSWQQRRQHFSSLLKWWEEGKSRIKGLSIKYCKNRNNCKSLERSILNNLASHLKSLVDSGRSSLQHVFNNTLSRLKALDLEIARGLQTRSRIQWVEEGESSSAFFLRLVKKNSVDRNITALRADDGSVISDQDGLSRLLCSFYADLFSASPCDPVAQAALLSNVSARLSPAESLACEGPLSQGECFAALQGMTRGRTPGCDGLPMEFYLRFWSVLGADLVLVLNSAFTLDSCLALSVVVLSPSLLRRAIVLTLVIGGQSPC